jgi:uncharacterized ion transporter superfamily protein YfcC
MMATFGVHSEVGKLRKVIVHRPELSLQRLTPSNHDELLFDDVLGIEDEAGNINHYNSGVLFGAIDVALFIIVIGGFLGVTMQTGAIQAGIGRLVGRLRGRERWMIPILMGSSPSAAPPTGWPRRAWPSTP